VGHGGNRKVGLRWCLRPGLCAFPCVEELQERLGFGVAWAELQGLVEIQYSSLNNICVLLCSGKEHCFQNMAGHTASLRQALV